MSQHVADPRDEQYYVAQHPETKLYVRGLTQFLNGHTGWMKAASPDHDAVREQIDLWHERRGMYTDDLQQANFLSELDAERVVYYVPELHLLKVNLTAK